MSIAPAPQPDPATPLLIERPNKLRERVGGPLDNTLAEKAEAAVQSLAKDFPQWIEETVTRLQQAHTALGGTPITNANKANLYTAALEAKSLGETYGYPLISRFANSLCRLLVRLPAQATAPHALVEAHVDAIRAVLRLPQTSTQDPVATHLLGEMEEQVRRFLELT